MDEREVEYRLVPGLPAYRVGNDGSVWKFYPGSSQRPKQFPPKWKRMSAAPNAGTGYPRVTLYSAGIEQQWFVHRLVLTVFVGPCPPGMLACHCDGNKLNNALTNLRWDTPKSNSNDILTHGRRPMGETIPWSKLTEEVVREIRRRHAGGVGYKRLAMEFNSRPTTIRAVVKRRSWAHVA